MRVEQLRQRLRALGAGPGHEAHVLRRWSQARPQDSGRRRIEHYLPQALRDELPALVAELAALARLRSEHPAADGSARLLVALADGQTVESVLLPRGGLCVSTQVGCAVGCVFCMTGRDGLLRQLGSAEIVAQVALARSAAAGEARSCSWAWASRRTTWTTCWRRSSCWAREGGIGHKNLVFSTVGDRRVFERLPAGRRCRPALALSLHTTKAALRARAAAARAAHRPRPTWSSWASATPAPPATRSSTSGRCSTASTTATTRSTASSRCWRASTR